MAKNLTSMKLPARDKTSEEKMYPTMAGEGPAYPYGLCIQLDHEQLEQLGIDKLPTADATITIAAKGKVTRTSEEQTEGGGSRRSVSIQLTHMGLGKGDKDGDE